MRKTQGNRLLAVLLAVLCSAQTSPVANLAYGEDVEAQAVSNAPIPAVAWRGERFCGVNCLYALLRINRIAADYEALCGDAKIGDNGTSLAELTRLAGNYGIKLTAVRGDAHGHDKWPLPSIVHQTMPDGTGHFVLLLQYDGETYTTLDCISGQIQQLTVGDFLDRWSGFLLVRLDEESRFSYWGITLWLVMGGLIFTLSLLAKLGGNHPKATSGA